MAIKNVFELEKYIQDFWKDNDIINNRRDAPASIRISNYLNREVREGNYRVTKRRAVGDKVLLHFTIVGDEQE